MQAFRRGPDATRFQEMTMDRRIKATKRDRAGNIVALCNPGQSWSPRRKADVIKDITSSRKSYYVQELTQRRYVRVVAPDTLLTTDDTASKNNLDNLPVC
jgi:hypothetical protein